MPPSLLAEVGEAQISSDGFESSFGKASGDEEAYISSHIKRNEWKEKVSAQVSFCDLLATGKAAAMIKRLFCSLAQLKPVPCHAMPSSRLTAKPSRMKPSCSQSDRLYHASATGAPPSASPSAVSPSSPTSAPSSSESSSKLILSGSSGVYSARKSGIS